MRSVISDRGGWVELVVRGPVDEETLAAARRANVESVVLSEGLGFQEDSLEFLLEFPFKDLSLNSRRMTDLSVLESLGSRLRGLTLTVSSDARLDVAALPALESLWAEWGQVEEGFSALTTLRHLTLDRYTGDDLRPLTGNSRLEFLSLRDRPRVSTLDGVEAFTQLGVLDVSYASRRTSIAPIAPCLPTLQRLEIETCKKVRSLDVLASAQKLEVLNIANCGDIDSLAPLAGLDNLRLLYAWESTNVTDGDLTPLLTLPSLEEIRMQSRRSYTPSLDEVKSTLGIGA